MYTSNGYSCVISYNEYGLLNFAGIFPTGKVVLPHMNSRIRLNKDAAKFFLKEFLVLGNKFFADYPDIRNYVTENN